MSIEHRLNRILVVDDDESIRQLLVDYLVDRGYQVDTDADGKTALDHISSAPPDIVLLDLMMPGITGMAVLEEIQKLHPGLPVILISGYADEELAREALRLGAHDFFLKPFDLETIEMHLFTKLEMLEAGEETDTR